MKKARGLLPGAPFNADLPVGEYAIHCEYAIITGITGASLKDSQARPGVKGMEELNALRAMRCIDESAAKGCVM